GGGAAPPLAAAAIRHCPGASPASTYEPSAPAVTVTTAPVVRLVAVTLAPAWASVWASPPRTTLPWIAPVTVWARAGAARPHSASATAVSHAPTGPQRPPRRRRPAAQRGGGEGRCGRRATRGVGTGLGAVEQLLMGASGAGSGD